MASGKNGHTESNGHGEGDGAADSGARRSAGGDEGVRLVAGEILSGAEDRGAEDSGAEDSGVEPLIQAARTMPGFKKGTSGS
jgi:hypothetical protein